MTLQKLIDNIKSNLGNRATGMIGTKTVEVAILDAINQSFRRIPINSFAEYAQRVVPLILEADENTYDLPEADINDEAVKILDILDHQFLANAYSVTDPETQEVTDYPASVSSITQLTYVDFNTICDQISQEETGIPSYYMRFGAKLKFFPTPDKAYTLYLYCRCSPADLEIADVADAVPVSDEWLLPLEAYATYICYLALQQTALASAWYTTYEDTRKESEHLMERRIALNRGNDRSSSNYNRQDDPWAKTDFSISGS